MQLDIVDTNVIVRFLTRDNPELAARAQRFFEQIQQGKLQVTTSEVVILEVIFVLSSKRLYNLSRAGIRTKMEDFIRMKGVKMPNKRLCIRALEFYEIANIDFVDAYLAAFVEVGKAAHLISFDKKIDRISTVQRKGP